MPQNLKIALVVLALCRGAPTGADTPPNAAATPIVIQNYYYALPGKADEVYRWRIHASDVRARLGLAVGRVLRRVPSPSGQPLDPELPDVVWECEYPDAHARSAEVAKLELSTEFGAVEAHMQTLLRQFRRATYSGVTFR